MKINVLADFAMSQFGANFGLNFEASFGLFLRLISTHFQSQFLKP
jgi:hypothetical protein